MEIKDIKLDQADVIFEYLLNASSWAIKKHDHLVKATTHGSSGAPVEGTKLT